MRLREAQKSPDSQPPKLGTTYANWTREQLVRELLSIDRAIERFTKENETLMLDNKRQAQDIEELNALLYKESQKIEDYKHKIIKESGKVMIVEDESELHARVFNDLGVNHAITQKEFTELKQKLFKAEKRAQDLDQEFTIKEVNYKQEIERIRTERIEAERKMIGLDSALKSQISAANNAQEGYSNSLEKLQTERDEAIQKLEWYMENQNIIDEDQDKIKVKDDRISELKGELNTLKSKDNGRQRINALEKQVRDLQSALAKKNPDSIPLMLEAVQPSIAEQEEYRKLISQNQKLQKQLQDKDDDFDRKLRNLRLETDKMKANYEKSKSRPVPEDVKDRRIEDLERQVQDTKDYYLDKIKKLQATDGAKVKGGEAFDRKTQIKEEMHLLNKIETLQKENESLKKASKKQQSTQGGAKPADISLSIDALINEDYSFCL